MDLTTLHPIPHHSTTPASLDDEVCHVPQSAHLGHSAAADQFLHAAGYPHGHHLDGVVPEVDGLVGAVVAEQHRAPQVVQLQLW